MTYWLTFGGMFLLRLAELVKLAIQNTSASWVLLAIELPALILGCFNAKQIVLRPELKHSLGTTGCYVLGAILLPSTTPTLSGNALIAVGFIGSFAVLGWLGTRFSIGPPGLVTVQDRGPYGIIRHPQALCRILIISGVLTGATNDLAAIACYACFGLAFACSLIEEDLLSRDEAYREYSKRVKARWIPGVL